MKTIEVDCLVIGTGLAGCATALSLSDRGVDTLMITRSKAPQDNATSMAQGGIVYRADKDSTERLVRDILEAGAGYGLEKAVAVLAKEGPDLVKEILVDRLKIPFDREPEGPFHLAGEAAHSFHRILHCGDHTGREIERAFLSYLTKSTGIKILTEHTAVDLLTLAHHSIRASDLYEEPRCIGAFLLDQKSNEMIACIAKETVLATGGLGQLYLHTTNPAGARGDGLAMAYRTGARIMNLEYVQFHPTALYGMGTDRFLITEALRGEGGKLINHEGKEFMDRYDSREGLAPRDVVARAIHDEMLREEVPCEYLDVTHLSKDTIAKRFPGVYSECLRRGLDITTTPIPVVPAAHYSCGGVAVDLSGNTTLRNLKAVGEVACSGVHGANRLASTSLLEDLVWGVRAGNEIAERLGRLLYSFPTIHPWKPETKTVDKDLLTQDWLTIKHTMWNYVGLVRTPKRLERAQRILRELSDEIGKFYSDSMLSDDLVGLRNGITSAQLILTAASRNHQGVGCHFLRED